jgi:outer membrane murein-binding lipoprotein Lpp
MLKNLTHIVVLGAVAFGSLLATGCASSNSEKPHALTGDNGATSAAEQKERQRYTDDKGRYRADLRLAGVAPLRQVP